MESFLISAHRVGRFVFDVRVLYLIAGLIMSVVAHELVHVLMHLGSIDAIHFFPSFGTIIAIDVNYVPGYDIGAEEDIAYAVTFLIQLITIIDVFAIHDSRDRRTAEQALFGSHDHLSEQESNFLLQIISK